MQNHLKTPITAIILLSTLQAAAGPAYGEKYIPVKEGVTTTIRTTDRLTYALWKDLPIEIEYTQFERYKYLMIKPTGEIRQDNGIVLISEWGDVHFYRLQKTDALKIPTLKIDKMDKEPFQYLPVQQGDTVRLSPSLVTVMEVPYKVFRFSFASKNLPISVMDVTPSNLKSVDDSFEKLVFDTDRTLFRFEFPDTLAAGYTDSLAVTDILGVDHTFIVKVDPEKTYPYVRDCTDGPQPVAEEEELATEEPENNYKGLPLALLLLLGIPIALGITIASTIRRKRIRKEELEKRFAEIEGSVQGMKESFQKLRFNLGREIREDLKKVIDRDVEAIIATKADKLRELINPSLEQYNKDIDRKTAQAQALFQKNINDILRQKISEINLMELAERAVGQYATLQLNKAISDEVSRKIGLITAKSSIELSEAERQRIVASITKTLTEEYHKLIDRVNQRKSQEYENDLQKNANQQKQRIIADLNETLGDIFGKKKQRYMNLELDDPLSDYIRKEIARQIRNFFIYNYGFLPITEIEPTEEQ